MILALSLSSELSSPLAKSLFSWDHLLFIRNTDKIR